MPNATLRTSLAVYVIAAAAVLAGCKPAATTQEPPPASPPEATAGTTSPEQASTGAPLATSPSLADLQQFVGSYPSDSQPNFLELGVLAERLKQLLGPDYATFLLNMGTASPLTQDGTTWFITGNRPHEGGMEEAALVIDAPQNAIRAWMLHDNKVHEWADPTGAQLPWPKDVQTMLDNQKNKP